MASQLASLAIMLLVSALAPFLASLVPGRAVPAVVLLVFAGAALGPHGLGLVETSGEAVSLLSQLGMSFLFLMAGYEIEPARLVSRTGAHAALCWAASLGVALLLVRVPALGIAARFPGAGSVAFAIMLTTTAYGTLAPIMRARHLVGTPVGEALAVYGATGEVLPVFATAFLLSTRSSLATTVSILVFAAICVALAFAPRRAARRGSRLDAFLRSAEGDSSQSVLRLVVLLVVFLVALAEAVGLDAVLGAFAAGFVLRHVFPDGNPGLEGRLSAIGDGFLVPVFFVASGAGLDLAAAFRDLPLLLLFVALLVLVRGVPVAVSLAANPETRPLSGSERFVVCAYCVMALPLLVAIGSRACDLGVMSEADASVLVCAGAVTVLVVPVVTSLVRVAVDVHPVRVAREAASPGADAAAVWREHLSAARERRRSLRARHGQGRARGVPADEYLARRRRDDGGPGERG